MGPHVFPAHTVQEAYELVLAEDLVADMLLADAYLVNQRSTLFMGEFLAAKTVPRFTWILLITSRRGPSRGSASAASAAASAPAIAFSFFFRTGLGFGRWSSGNAFTEVSSVGGRRFGGRRFGGRRFGGRRFGGRRFGGRRFGGRRFGGRSFLGNNMLNP